MYTNNTKQIYGFKQIINKILELNYSTSFEYIGWNISVISMGWFNKVVRVKNDEYDLIFKFFKKDHHYRYLREYNALSLLASKKLHIAPVPIYYNDISFDLPVLIEPYIISDNTTKLTFTKINEWSNLVKHFLVIHSIKPQDIKSNINNSVLNANSISCCHRIIKEQLSYLNPQKLREKTKHILFLFKNTSFKEFRNNNICLCRCDNNLNNFIIHNKSWMSIDWEYSGWGDPAFDIASLFAHPSCLSNIPINIKDFSNIYSNDKDFTNRVKTYYKILIVWWLIHIERYINQIPISINHENILSTEKKYILLEMNYCKYSSLAYELYS